MHAVDEQSDFSFILEAWLTDFDCLAIEDAAFWRFILFFARVYLNLTNSVEID